MEGGPPCFPPGSTCPAVLGVYTRSHIIFAYEAFTLCGPAFHPGSANDMVCNSLSDLQLTSVFPATPAAQRLQAITHSRFGLLPVRSPLLGESLLISFPPVTKMFQFTGSGPSHPMDSGVGSRGSPMLGSPIRISTDLCSLAAPRSLSQLATSFFASWHQGIPRTPLLS